MQPIAHPAALLPFHCTFPCRGRCDRVVECEEGTWREEQLRHFPHCAAAAEAEEPVAAAAVVGVVEREEKTGQHAEYAASALAYQEHTIRKNCSRTRDLERTEETASAPTLPPETQNCGKKDYHEITCGGLACTGWGALYIGAGTSCTRGGGGGFGSTSGAEKPKWYLKKSHEKGKQFKKSHSARGAACAD